MEVKYKLTIKCQSVVFGVQSVDAQALNAASLLADVLQHAARTLSHTTSADR
jgi:hypothetical protein